METVMLLRVPEPETGVLNLTSGPDRSRLSPLVVIVTGAEIGNAGIKIGISHDRLIQKSSGCGGGYAETCRKH